MDWKNRIQRVGEVDPTTLTPHPRNARRHPPRQRRVLSSVLDEVGYIQDVIVNERSGYVVDGHLRLEVALERGQATIPVKYVDLSEEDEALALATFDPVGDLAYLDIDAMAELAEAVGPVSDAIDELLADLAPERPSYDYDEPAPPPPRDDDASPAPDDDPDDPEPDPPLETSTLWIQQTGIPMTDSEYQSLVYLYQQYVETRGMTFGFAGWLFRAVHP